jgi:hypothetical protein
VWFPPESVSPVSDPSKNSKPFASAWASQILLKTNDFNHRRRPLGEQDRSSAKLRTGRNVRAHSVPGAIRF